MIGNFRVALPIPLPLPLPDEQTKKNGFNTIRARSGAPVQRNLYRLSGSLKDLADPRIPVFRQF